MEDLYISKRDVEQLGEGAFKFGIRLAVDRCTAQAEEQSAVS